MTMRDTKKSNEARSEKDQSNCNHVCIEEIMQHNIQIGQYFFDKAAMRFFSSRILPTIYGGRFFVSSEQDKHEHGAWVGERRYTIRECVNGRIVSRSEHGEFATVQDAKNAAREFVADSEPRTIVSTLVENQISLALVFGEDALKVR